MFARWYSLFLGFLLVVLGIAGLIAAGVLPATQGALITISIIWLITAAAALWMGFAVKNLTTVRWFAGIVGGLYFLWGAIQIFTAPAAAAVGVLAAVASVGGFVLLLGSLGLAAALVPATWTREAEMRSM